MKKLAVITSHPIQYYAPWFRNLAKESDLDIKVFYLWNFGVTQQLDVGFQQQIKWDIDLLTGYSYEFVDNISSDPGTHHFWGLQNPTLVSQVTSYKPDAVLLLNYNYASLYQFLWRWRKNSIPLLFRGDSHRLIPRQGIKEWMRREFISTIYRQFGAILYVGQANYAYFSYHKVPKEKLFFTPHAVDNDRFFAQAAEAIAQANFWRQEIGIPGDNSIVLFAGKFEEKKRPTDLIKAFIEANLERVSLLLVGAGSLETEMRSLAADCPQIYFMPFQNQSFMPRTYAIADLVVLPSYGSQETWGLAVNEAMCMSRPVIVSDLVGCSQDLVRSYENGLVFPAGNVSALAASLKTAFQERSQLSIWGQKSREIIAKYSYKQMTEGLVSALKNLGVLGA